MLVKKHFEETILPHINIESRQTISTRTARRWMHTMGFRFQRYQKGVYIDGHERPDVVTYREKFLQEVANLDHLMSKWLDTNCKVRTFPTLIGEEKEHVWITHDESVFHTYDGPRTVWGLEGEHPLRKKGQGQGVHVSDFLTETIGPLKDDLEEARVTMILGANRDGYWNNTKLIEQVEHAINIFERTHPDCIGVFAFDNATSHTAFAEDALVASKMNLNPGGSVPKMHDTLWNGQRQSMIIENDYIVYDKKTKKNINLRSQPKGIQWILTERGLWYDGMVLDCNACKNKESDPNIIDCCARRLIANQPDFLAECGRIQHIIEMRGHKVINQFDLIYFFYIKKKIYFLGYILS